MAESVYEHTPALQRFKIVFFAMSVIIAFIKTYCRWQEEAWEGEFLLIRLM
jgi:hypothetical protein